MCCFSSSSSSSVLDSGGPRWTQSPCSCPEIQQRFSEWPIPHPPGPGSPLPIPVPLPHGRVRSVRGTISGQYIDISESDLENTWMFPCFLCRPCGQRGPVSLSHTTSCGSGPLHIPVLIFPSSQQDLLLPKGTSGGLWKSVRVWRGHVSNTNAVWTLTEPKFTFWTE